MKAEFWALAAALAWSAPSCAQDAPPSSEPRISQALSAYNALPMGLGPLSLAHPGEYGGAATLPDWLAQIPLTQQEAAAIVAFQSAYRLDPIIRDPGSSRTYSGHKPGVLEYVAAATVSLAANDDHQRRAARGNQATSPATGPANTVTYVQPASYYTPDGLYSRLLGQLGGCRGALTSALRKMTKEHADEHYVIDLSLLVSASEALDRKPDPFCRRGV